MLKNRLLSAAAIISSSLLFVFLDALNYFKFCPGCWMTPLGIYMYLGSAIECIAMIASARKKAAASAIEVGPSALSAAIGYDVATPALFGTIAVIVAACIPVYWPLIAAGRYPPDSPMGVFGWPLLASVFALAGSFAWSMRGYAPASGAFQRSILSGWIAVYFGIAFAFAVALRITGESRWGLALVVGMIVITKFGDAGAYFSGRALGRTKLCPNVSPGKTIEGLIGGIVIAAIAGWIYFGMWAPYAFGNDRIEVSLLRVIVLAVALTISGVIGDLLQSIFKREMGCKDSGRMMPGLGGLWDVTDSLLPACAVGYLAVTIGLISGPGQ